MGVFILNYIVGIFLFIIDRLFLRYDKTEEEEAKAKLEVKRELFNLETSVNRDVAEEDRISAKSIFNKLEKLRENEWTCNLVILIMYLLPIINVYVFYGSVLNKLNHIKNK